MSNNIFVPMLHDSRSLPADDRWSVTKSLQTDPILYEIKTDHTATMLEYPIELDPKEASALLRAIRKESDYFVSRYYMAHWEMGRMIFRLVQDKKRERMFDFSETQAAGLAENISTALNDRSVWPETVPCSFCRKRVAVRDARLENHTLTDGSPCWASDDDASVSVWREHLGRS